jgi:predicted PurR-regulated permease PerM
MAALALALIGVAVASNIDNVARLVVFRRVSGIHPMLTLVGAFAGVRVFGAIGVFLGPLILSFMMELVRSYEELIRLSEGRPPVAHRSSVTTSRRIPQETGR